MGPASNMSATAITRTLVSVHPYFVNDAGQLQGAVSGYSGYRAATG